MIICVGSIHWDTSVARWLPAILHEQNCPLLKCDDATWWQIIEMATDQDGVHIDQEEFNRLVSKLFGIFD